MLSKIIFNYLLTKTIGEIMADNPIYDYEPETQQSNKQGEQSMSATTATAAGGGGLVLGGLAGGVLGYMLGRSTNNNNCGQPFGFASHNHGGGWSNGFGGVGYGVPVASAPVVVAQARCGEGYNESYNNLVQRIDNFEIRGTERNGHLEKEIAVNRVKAEFEARLVQDSILLANANTINHIDKVNAANIIDRKNDELASAYRQLGDMKLAGAVNALSCEIKGVGGIAMGAVNAINHLSNCLCECNPKPAPTKVFPDFCAERCEDGYERRRLDEILYAVKQINPAA